MEKLDRSMRETEAEQRKKFLIMNLKKLGINRRGTRMIEALGLAELEWIWIEQRNKTAREIEEAGIWGDDEEISLMREKYYFKE